MILVKLVEPIAKLVYKIVKLSLHICEFILPKKCHQHIHKWHSALYCLALLCMHDGLMGGGKLKGVHAKMRYLSLSVGGSGSGGIINITHLMSFVWYL